jgi:YD repeat-containing protein
MKTFFAVFFVTSSLFGQIISSNSQGPIYDRDGRMIAYRYTDTNRELYAYDSAGSLATFVDRTGHLTQLSPAADEGGNATSESATTSTSGPPDATLFTTYTIASGHTGVGWVVCGSTQLSEGCYSSGNLGPFGKVGALVESNPSTNSNGTVTRSIFVLDVASGSKANGVTLYVYKKTDTVTAASDTVNVTLSKTLGLPIVGGTSALASMVANSNGKYLVVGTNQSAQAVEIQRSNFSMTTISGFSPPINVAAITKDDYGYVTITFGSFNSSNNGFVVLGPNGNVQEDGGGAEFMLGTGLAILPSTFQ